MTKDWYKFIEKNPYREKIKEIILDISNNNLTEYNLVKLKWIENYYRIRVWKIRIVFSKDKNWNKIIAVDTRGNIYKWLK